MEEKLETLKNIIQERALITSNQEKIISHDGRSAAWIFDLRKVFLDPEFLSLSTDVLWSFLEKEYPFQIGGQELAAVPLISALILKSHQAGKPISGFIIRKSRKKIGLQKFMEGPIDNQKIILIDDLINSGGTILRQLDQIERIGKKVDSVFTIINFKGEKNAEKLKNHGVGLHSLFTLSDFGLKDSEAPEIPDHFQIIWKFQSPNPSYTHVVPKSTPAIDNEKVYFGSDSEYFWAINQKDGSVAWKFKVGYPVQEKSIFSSPAICGDSVYFGAYDGNVYALNKNTGRLEWKNMDADFVGSSPAIAPGLGLLFIGLEFGLFTKRGGIAALNLHSGKKIWDYKTGNFIHCSPVYCPEKKVVAVGDNDGYVYLFDAKKGELRWKFQTDGAIKSSLAFDTSKNLLLFGSFDKNLYALDISSGKVKGNFKTKEAIYSTPKVFGDNVYFSSLDKHLYSLNLKTGNLNWDFATNGRIFSSPEIIGNNLFIGSNDGKLYEIDTKTGKLISSSQFTERITNKIVFNKETKNFFILTFANEIYCLKHNLISND